MSFLQRRRAGGAGTGGDVVWEDEAFSSSYPALFEFLTAVKWPDGATRETGTLLVFCEAGKLTLCLSDRDGGAVTFRTAQRFLEALEGLEDGLQTDSLDWRQKKGPPPRKGK